MKLLTLNTHSLMENDYESKLDIFVNAVLFHKPDVVALQEIMQPISNSAADYPHINAGAIPLKKGNHGLNIVKKLNGWNLVWLGFKKSYEKFDEGLAILTPHQMDNINVITLSPFDDYTNWKTRKALGVKINGEWFYSVHMGWWENIESPFAYELNSLTEKIPKNTDVWLMGDFNSDASERNKGYDLILEKGFNDTYALAKNKDNGITAYTNIDGWDKENDPQGIRIDYIFSTQKADIESSFTIFNGANEPNVSDHFGILVTTRKEKE